MRIVRRTATDIYGGLVDAWNAIRRIDPGYIIAAGVWYWALSR